ncbi:uncharacterized protein E0L32_007934 [Thyridium curvatum]|uniref:NACHT domain-containing protein n=1 Tax=Thyridium curvatum TaxID=1093900 RepID=A0A507ATK7_9PEZI|nr:uncharacterized protein E0L32_007934 [Thyridium curvatum]TPX11073.1 hypothetical protein E0L32_007934 [Thyridium curvatum]
MANQVEVLQTLTSSLREIQDRIVKNQISAQRESLGDTIKSSPDFQRLEPHEKASVLALLKRFRDSHDDEELLRYYKAVMRFITGSRASVLEEPQVLLAVTGSQIAEVDLWRGVDDTILGLLQYRVISDRRDMIADPYSSSCEWAFQYPTGHETHASLSEWLTCGSGIFLLLGNEASGKSTIMKYILRHERTRQCLKQWAGTDKLLTAPFFFWCHGTELERAEEGLLRSLLYSVLLQDTRLAPIIFPSEWTTLYSSMSSGNDSSDPGFGPWKIEGLRRAFQQLIRQDQIPLKLFFLIDGIDEYDSVSDIERFPDFIKFLSVELAASKNTKALLSSRPLEDLKQLKAEASLILHQLNHNDIELYAREALERDENYRAIRELNPERSEEVLRYIARGSDGSFLRAKLAVQIITQKLEAGGEPWETEYNLLGPASQEWYRVIWSTLDRFTKSYASQILQILLVGTDQRYGGPNFKDSMTLIDLALAVGDPNTTIEASIRPWNLGQFQIKCDQIASSFTKKWPGFINVDQTAGHKGWNAASRIQYCHRSVPEFLAQEETRRLLLDATKGLEYDFTPRIAHLKSVVQHLKVLPSPLPKEPARCLWNLATQGLLAAKQIDQSDEAKKETYTRLLSELDRTMEHHHIALQRGPDGKFLESRLQDPHGLVALRDRGLDARRVAKMHWSNFHFDPKCSHDRFWNDSFLSLTIQFGLNNYVKKALDQGSKISQRKRGRPLLSYALCPLPVAPYGLITQAMVEILLEHGGSPNQKFVNTCCEDALIWQWETFVDDNARSITGAWAESQRVADARAEVILLLIEKGADLSAEIKTARGQSLPARRVILDSLRAWASPDVYNALKESVEKAENSSRKKGGTIWRLRK